MIIYKIQFINIKHQIEFKSVIDELNLIVDCWCDEQLTFRYCKSRHIPKYNDCRNKFKGLNDYEDSLFVDLNPNDILNIINHI